METTDVIFIASLVFGILIIDHITLEHGDLIFDVVMLTVLLSTVAHGFTAAPWAERYEALASHPRGCLEEYKAVADDPTRVRS